MHIDKDEVAIGDRLYDVWSQQYGTVESIQSDRLMLKYPNGDQVRFFGHSFNGMRRLYWHNPMIYVPKKGDGDFVNKVREMVKVLRK